MNPGDRVDNTAMTGSMMIHYAMVHHNRSCIGVLIDKADLGYDSGNTLINNIS